LWAAVVCAFKLSPRYTAEILLGPWMNEELRFIGYGMPLFMALGLQLTSLQRTQAGFRALEVLAQAFAGVAGGMLLFFMIHAVVEFHLIGRFVLIFSLLYGVGFILGSRLVIGKLAEQHQRNVLVYGTKASFDTLATQLAAHRLPVRVVGHARLENLLPKIDEEFAKARHLPLDEYCRRHGAEEIVVELPDALTRPEREALLHCTGTGISVVELSYFFERNFERVFVQGLRESWFWGYDPAHLQPVYFWAKRATDIGISLLGLLCFAPLFPFVYAIIKLQDGGPVLYSQVRVGLNNQPFHILKFRTMRVDAEKHGAQWAKKNDNRVTWFGRMMRKTRIDEVPQFWNILKGEMSFIGPRPERPEFVDAIEREVPYYRYRHLIKPGLTGWAQVSYPYGASIEDARQKLSYDLYYMKYGTFTRELHILLRTVVAMVKGAR
jgi:exopolysaccharide biosynthesis polyprenyl glycosylphosphotransferase